MVPVRVGELALAQAAAEAAEEQDQRAAAARRARHALGRVQREEGLPLLRRCAGRGVERGVGCVCEVVGVVVGGIVVVVVVVDLEHRGCRGRRHFRRCARQTHYVANRRVAARCV